MFDELLIVAGFLIFSIILSYILLKYTPNPLNKLVLGLAIIGIVIHELCHLLMCIITKAPIKSINLLERVKLNGPEESQYGYRGSVTINMEKQLTFLQALLIGVAPLIFSFWLFFSLWDLILTEILDVFGIFIIIFLMISIVLAAAPSAVDILNIPYAFRKDPKYSCYQILLLVLSIISIWFIYLLYPLSLIHEIFNYLIIMVFYYGYKYLFKGIKIIWEDTKYR